METLHLDWEIFSRLPLGTQLGRYARHPSTDPICLCWSRNRMFPRAWMPGLQVEPLLEASLRDPSVTVHAHNAPFELYMVNYVGQKYGLPPLPASRMRCSAARAAHANMPRALETVGQRLGVGQGKDMVGHDVMLKLCKPDKDGRRLADPHGGPMSIYEAAMRDRCLAYCARDLTEEMDVEDNLPPLPEQEEEYWQLDRRINQRGVPVDLEFCRGALKILDQAYEEITEQLDTLTGGQITSGHQRDRILNRLNAEGFFLGDLQAETVEWALEKPEVTGIVRSLLELRQMAAPAAVKKYQAAVDMAVDGRVVEGLLYYGALTGRWTGKGVQFHNFKKGIELDEGLIEQITYGELGVLKDHYFETPIQLLSKSVRGLVCAGEGKQLLMSDYAQVEARIAHWLAGDQAMLDIFANKGDPYIGMAGKIFGVPVSSLNKESPQRKYGKSAVLGCGYGMGARKFGGQYNVEATLAKRCVEVYRRENPKICQLWRNIDKAVARVVHTGQTVQVGRLTFAMEDRWMTMRLPSGRKLYYFQPRMVQGQKGMSFRYWSREGIKHVWGGHFLENACQAISRDLLVAAMLLIERLGIDILFSVHDEIVMEVDDDAVDDARREVEQIMLTGEGWTHGLPLGVESEIKKRFEKLE